MEIKYRELSELATLSKNPRIIKDYQFQKLCDSLENNPQYFEARPLILSNRTGELVIIAGNQRYLASKHLKKESVPTVLIENLNEVQEKEITIKDNLHNGEWDWELLANEWDQFELNNFGLDIPDFETVNFDDFVLKEPEFKKEDSSEEKKHKCPSCGYEF